MAELARAATAAALSLALALPLAGTAVAAPERPAATVQPAAAAVPADTLQLPRPTGPYAVGRSTKHLVDRSRTDPWTPTADGRELMVTLHYPAARAGDGRTARYSTVEEAALLAKGQGIEALVPAERLSATRTHGLVGARPAKGKHPLVILSPGFTVSRYTQTNLAEDLASRGYVVASLDHAYESYGISLPGGRTLTCAACPVLESDWTKGSVVTATRAADVSYVLDRLTGKNPVWRHAGVIDGKRVGMAGHSIGGASAATAMARDRRVDAGVNMDGSFWEELPAEGLRGRPFMMLGTDDDIHRPGGKDTTWDRMWPTLDGWKRWLTVAGSDHFTFSDGPLISHHFGLPEPPLPATRAVAVTRDYVAAFFDQHLRGEPQPLLSGPTAANPEVKFHNP
ncbi:alpha/beta hydrolase family protein [Streptomyces sp. NPDC014894]|uniref:alpha/beta hydrolase family protein n=1 Tax=Streptomyces sp. NPDC014894 TaxID=3364931 RepID=UPI0036F9CC73